MFAGIVKAVWHNALPVDDGERAELIKKLAQTLAKKNDVDYEDMVDLLASILIDDVDDGDMLWLDEAEAQKESGSAAFSSRITSGSKMRRKWCGLVSVAKSKP